MEIDLHTHSIYSDGINTPEELLQMAYDKHLKYLALTDHDFIEGSKALVKLPHPNMTIYSGVEMSAKVPKGQMHILGYNIDLDNQELNNTLLELRNISHDTIHRYLDILSKEFKINFSKEDLDKLFSSKGNIGRPEIGKLLIKDGYVKDMDEAFAKYLNYVYECIRDTKKTLSKEEIITLINNAGGIAVLAHPWSLKLNNQELHDEVSYLVSIGLKGIETVHSDDSTEQRAYYKELAKEFNLIETGGTDYHGYTVKPEIELGSGINNNVDINEDDITITKYIKSRY